MRFFICGSALRGQPGHSNLGGAPFVAAARTAPKYRMASVRDEHPGVYEADAGGVSLAGEIYEFTPEQYRTLLESEPPDLYEAPIELEDGSTVNAMLYPASLIAERGYPDVSEFGGWAAYRASLNSVS